MIVAGTGEQGSNGETSLPALDVERWRVVKADRDAAWEYLKTCRDELVGSYPGEEIALHGERIVAHAADPADFERLVEEYVAASGTDRSSLHFEHLDPDPPFFAG